MKKKPIKRSFMYRDIVLPDIDPALSPDEIKDHYSSILPELSQAVIDETVVAKEEVVYTFRPAIGLYDFGCQ